MIALDSWSIAQIPKHCAGAEVGSIILMWRNSPL
jgi:hypothetical protein